MKNTQNIWFLGSLCGVALMALSACAPVREVHNEYTFTPPTDEAGLMCAEACVQAHAGCVQSCEARKVKCNAFERRLMSSAAIKEVGDDPACEVTVCENRCAETLSSCYVGCGGAVAKQKVVTRPDMVN